MVIKHLFVSNRSESRKRLKLKGQTRENKANMKHGYRGQGRKKQAFSYSRRTQTAGLPTLPEGGPQSFSIRSSNSSLR